MNVRGIANTHRPLPVRTAASQPVPLFGTRRVRFAGRDLTIMSFNANHLVRLDGGQYEKKAQAIAGMILPHDPDVIALQEVRDREIVAELNERYLKGRYPNISCFEYEDSQRLAVLSKADISQEDAAHVYAGENADMLRGMLQVKLQAPGVEPLNLFNMHLRAGGSQKRRIAQLYAAETGRSYIDKAFDEAPDGFHALLGDGNVIGDAHGRKVLDTLAGKNHPNPRRRLVEVFENSKGRVYTWKRGKKQAKLDYAFVSPNLLMRVKDFGVCGDVNPVASDHRPIKLTVHLPDRKPAGAENPVRENAGRRVSLFA